MFIQTLKFIVLFSLSTNALSEDWMHLGAWSKHPKVERNETHNLIGVEIDSYFLHKFNNSFKNTSYYLGKVRRDKYCLDDLCLGYSYGIVHGYLSKKIFPIVMPVISYDFNGIGADISCIPGKVCAIQFRFAL